jgi:type I restriction enzyme R subunit
LISERKQRAISNANNIGKTEAETREIIDEQLRAAGWECDTNTLNYKINKTLPQKGKNRAIAEWSCGSKWADYALFIGTELYGIVEAKKFVSDISTDLHQSKIYSKLIQPATGIHLLETSNNYKVPFLFSANGRSYLEQIKTRSGMVSGYS